MADEMKELLISLGYNFDKKRRKRRTKKEIELEKQCYENEKFKGISFNISDNVLKLSSHNPEHDEANEELIIEYQGEPLSISFNSQYLLDAVSNIDSELAVMTIASNASSCFIEEPEQQPYKFIVMPMRL